MVYKDKKDQMRDFVALELMTGRRKAGQPFFEKKYFTSKFKVNPSYVDDLIVDLEKEGLIAKNKDGYIFSANDKQISWLKEEYLQSYISEFLDNVEKIDFDIDQAIEIIRQRTRANG